LNEKPFWQIRFENLFKKNSETVNLKNLRRFNGKIIFLNQIFGVQKTGERIKNGKNARFKQNLGINIKIV
jgi:hypothetical protein